MARVFFAVFPDRSTRAALAERVRVALAEGGRVALAQSARVASGQGVRVASGGDGATARAVPADNHHLTLAFVGSVPAARIGELQRVLGELRGEACTVRLERLEYWRRAQVLALVALRMPAPLRALHAALSESLARAGFAVDAQPFRAHVTIARKVMQAPVATRVVPLDWPIESVSLVLSDTSGKTSRYTVVATQPLLDNGAAPAT